MEFHKFVYGISFYLLASTHFIRRFFITRRLLFCRASALAKNNGVANYRDDSITQ